MKKVLSLLIAVALTITLIPQWSSLVSANTNLKGEKSKGDNELVIASVEDYQYSVYGSEITITGINDNTVEEIDIPEKIEGKTVTKISDNAFLDVSSIKIIKVPTTVTSIGDSAFRGTSVESMTIPFVGQTRTASQNRGLLGHVFGYVKTSGENPEGTTQQWEENVYDKFCYFIPKTLRSVTITDASILRKRAFYNCDMLEEVSLNNGIETIERSAFCNCTNLKKANIPSSAT